MAVSLLARCQLQQHGVQLHSVPGRQNVVTCGLIAPQWHVGRRPTPRLAPVRAVSGRADDVSLGWNCGFTSNYSLGQMLGKGSFGEVRQAINKQNGRCVAVKVLNKRGKRSVHLEAISREVEAWRQVLGSKYVAKLEGLFEDEEHAYIVEELCADGDLKSLLDNIGTCSELEAATIMRGVLDMLVECHQHGICYGDLKPANIMFSQSTQPPSSPRANAPRLHVRAVDFGSSRATHKSQPLTQCCGTPLYMAPEMMMQRFGVGVDVWAAGVMLYQMLTGHLPYWPRKTLDQVAQLPPYEIIAAVRTYEVQFPRDVWCDFSAGAQDLLSRMLDRNPATRITAQQALAHHWLPDTLGYVPQPTGSMQQQQQEQQQQQQQQQREANNIVAFTGVQVNHAGVAG